MNVPAYLEGHVGQPIATEQSNADIRSYWVVVLGLKPVKDGDQYCFLWGENLQTGVVGFGPSPIEAMQRFQEAMYQSLKECSK